MCDEECMVRYHRIWSAAAWRGSWAARYTWERCIAWRLGKTETARMYEDMKSSTCHEMKMKDVHRP
jgi:hypothetical protein